MSKAVSSKGLSKVLSVILSFLMVFSLLPAVAFAAPAAATIVDVGNEEQLRLALENSSSPDIHLTDSFSIGSTVEISRPVNIDGNGKTITGPAAGHGFVVLANAVSFYNLTITGSAKSNLQFYKVTGGSLNKVTLSDAKNAGLIVNGSEVTVSDVTTKNNTWGGINVDQGSGVSAIPHLYVSDVTKHTSPSGKLTPAIWVDTGILTWVSAPGLYTEANSSDGMHLYYDKEEYTAATTRSVTSEAELRAALDDAAVTDIRVGGDFGLAATVEINRKVSIDGQNNVITGPAGDHGFVVLADDVAFTSLTITKSGRSNVQFYKVTGGSLSKVTLSDAKNAGMIVNGSKVSVSDVTTVNNTWGGINVDQGSGVTTIPLLTVKNVTRHTSPAGALTPAIWVDKGSNTGWVSAYGSGWYTETNSGAMHLYMDINESATADAKVSALAVLNAYKASASADYSADNWALIGTKRTAGIAAINAATTPAAVNEALKASKNDIDTVKTLAQEAQAAALDVKTDAELRAALASPHVSAIRITADFGLSSTAEIRKAVSIDGQNHTITGPAAGHGFTIYANDVAFSNLIITGSAKSNLNFYIVTGGSLNKVMLANAKNAGMIVNGSTVTITDVTTTNNAWGGINVDQGSGVSALPLLTVKNVTKHTSPAGKLTAAIWVDKGSNTGWVSAYGSGLYAETDSGAVHIYYDIYENDTAIARTAALDELNAYKTTSGDYSADNWALIVTKRTAGIAAINAATTPAAVTEALATAKANIDAVKTLAQEAQAAALNVKNEAELRSALTSTYVSVIHIAADFAIANTVEIGRTVSIDGQNHVITGPAAGHGFIVLANNVAISNLAIKGSAKSNLQFYVVTGGSLCNVNLSNAGNAGLIVNGSEVTVSHVSTTNNAWGGINVDQGKDVTAIPHLTVSDVTTHTSPAGSLTPAIWVDKGVNLDWVSAHGKGLYTETDSAPMHFYYDKAEYAAKELADARANALKELAAYKATESDYSPANWTLVQAKRTAGDGAINAATTPAEVTSALAAAKANIDAVKTLAQEAQAAALDVKSEAELRAALASSFVKDIRITKDFSLSATVEINRTVNLDGQTHTITGPAVGHGFTIFANGVAFSNLTITGSAKSNLNFYVVTGGSLNNVTLANAKNAGMIVNGSQVTITDVTTTNNAWGGINVDQGSGVLALPLLTVTNATKHTSPAGKLTAAIWVDKGVNTGWVSAYGSGLYAETDSGAAHLYYDKAEHAVSAALNVRTEAELRAALASPYVTVIQLADDFAIANTVEIGKKVSIDGKDHVITGPAAGHGIVVLANDVSLSNLTIQGSAKSNLQFYAVTGGSLTNVALIDAKNAGLIVNGSAVTISHVTTTNNTWGGINVDQGSGVSAVPHLTVSDVTIHNSPAGMLTPAIWVDKGVNLDWVSAHGKGWYTETDTAPMHFYYDMAEYAAKELADAKASALTTLNGYQTTESDYSPANWTLVQGKRADGIAAINTATTPAEVATALADAKAAIDAIKTIAQEAKDAQDAALKVKTEAELRAALASQYVTVIQLADDFAIANTVEIGKKVSIDGKDHIITGPAAGHGFIVLANEVSLSNLTIQGSAKSNLQFYVVTGGSLTNVTLADAKNAGLIVNGSKVTISHVTTKNNAWGGINVDQGSGVTALPLLTVTDATTHTSPKGSLTPAIWVDKGVNLDWVSAHGKGWYTETDTAPMHFYYDMAEYAAKELADAKASAVATLTGYKATESDYSPANWTLVEAKRADGIAAINTATTPAEVATALADAKAAIDAIKTIAQEAKDAQEAALKVKNEAELRVALASPYVTVIHLADDFAISSTVEIGKKVSIDGKDHIITGPSAGHGFIVLANEVSLSNLTIQGSAKSNLQFYVVTGGSLTNVTLADAKNAGLIVNGSKVTISHVTTTNNAWGGINVDQGSGVSALPLLTVSDATKHTSPTGKVTPAIWVDKGSNLDWVSAHGKGWYTETDSDPMHFYYDLAEYAKDAALKVKSEAELNAALTSPHVTVIQLADSFTLSSTVYISRTVSINGDGHAITGPAAGHGIVVLANGVALSHLTIQGSAKSNLQFYVVTGGSLTDVTLADAKNAGLIVNGSEVTVSGVTTKNNAWGGINVDQGSGVTAAPLLTVSDVTMHTSPAGSLTPAIWVDKGVNLDWVSAHSNGWYTETDTAPMHFYYDKAEYAAKELADAKASALTTLTGYQATESDYSPANWTLVEAKRAAGVTAINAATTPAEVAAALADAKAAIDAIKTIAQEAKDAQDAALKVKNEAELRSALASPYVTVIQLADDFAIGSTVEIGKKVSIDGKDHVITGPAAGHGFIVLANDVSLSNLTIKGSAKSNLQFYVVTGGSLTNVTLADAKNAGLIVNGSKVTISHVTTKNNAWGGINVDQGSGVTAIPLLTVTDATTHSSPTGKVTPAIWVDKGANTGWVSAYGSGDYTEIDSGAMHLYYDKAEYETVKILTSIAVKDAPKSSYIEGQSFDPANLTLTASYDNGTTATISTGYTCDVVDPLPKGDSDVTVKFGGQQTTFKVTAAAKSLTSIAVKAAPKTSYIEGQSFDPAGLTLTATYDNGSSETISTGYTIDAANPLPKGESTVTVMFGGQQTTLKVTAAAKSLTSIAVKAAPKTSYIEGQNFDPAGLTLTATYDNGSSETISTGYTIDVANPLPKGDSTVTIKYGGQQTTLKVTAAAKTLAGIAITTKPSKTTYADGQSFDATGMVVTASYNNGTTEAVTGYTIAPNAALTTADTKITVTYGGMSADLAITVLSKGSLRVTIKDTTGAIFAGVGLGIYSDSSLTHKVGEGVSDAATGAVQVSGLDAGTYWVVVASVPAGYKMPSPNAPIDFKVEYGPVTNATLVLEKSKTYAYNNSQLTNIQSTAGTLSPAFDPEKLKYTLTLDENTASAKITPVLADSSSKLYINGKKATSKTITLATGAKTTLTIKVQPKSGKALTYTVVVIRSKSTNATLASLKASKGTLTPKFGAASTAYTLELSNTQTSVTFTSKLAEQHAKSAFYLDGKKTSSRTVTLKPGQTKTYVISVKAQNGNITNYTITVRRAISHNADLAGLAVSRGTLTPAFAAAQTSYTLALTSAQSSVALKVKVADSTATYSIKVGGKASGKTISLAKGATKTVTVIVKSQAGDVKTYTLTVTRAN